MLIIHKFSIEFVKVKIEINFLDFESFRNIN